MFFIKGQEAGQGDTAGKTAELGCALCGHKEYRRAQVESLPEEADVLKGRAGIG